MKNLTISFKHDYRRPILSSRCDVISDVIVMKFIVVDDLHIIFLYLMSNYVYSENCEIFKSDKKFEVEANFFVISVTGSYVYYVDSQSNALHFDLLIDVLA